VWSRYRRTDTFSVRPWSKVQKSYCGGTTDLIPIHADSAWIALQMKASARYIRMMLLQIASGSGSTSTYLGSVCKEGNGREWGWMKGGSGPLLAHNIPRKDLNILMQ
jgi:hypothetical protein